MSQIENKSPDWLVY